MRGDNHKHQYKNLSKFLSIRKRNWKTWATKMFYPTKTMEQLTHKSTSTSINTSTSATHMGQTVGSIQSKSGLSSRWQRVWVVSLLLVFTCISQFSAQSVRTSCPEKKKKRTAELIFVLEFFCVRRLLLLLHHGLEKGCVHHPFLDGKILFPEIRWSSSWDVAAVWN